MANNKVGCSANRTHLIDPNKFGGQSSSDNISVPLEDLTISVELKTGSKGRTVLTATEQKEGAAESSKTVKVNFFEGSLGSDGKKNLTTRYTDLTTTFDKGENESENLGITNIDIDFNSSMTPMVVITFIDVRGSAIFQNEENISGNKNNNKYSVFFQLPYPMFELTIKGYYGQPVKYCLHMWKFNSRFNSQTGNFEITANFVGYTYAMFSDMLLGYLKAIPFTTIGSERYKIINEERAKVGLPRIMYLDELMINISNINKEIAKLSADDENARILANNEVKLNQLNTIENIVNGLGVAIDVKHDMTQNRYRYVTEDENLSTERINALTENYVTNITEAVNTYLEGSTLDLDIQVFLGILNHYYSELTLELLTTNTNEAYNEIKSKTSIATDDDLSKKITELTTYLKSTGISLKSKINVYDFTYAYNAIDEQRTNINLLTKDTKLKLGVTIKEKIKEIFTTNNNIPFDPTVRNIVEVFTTAIEVFMETIWTVSNKAEIDSTGKRVAQLSSRFSFNDPYVTDIKANDLQNKKYWAWPDYREKEDEKSGYVEKYLGAPAVLEVPSDVDELFFIDDLLLAFLRAQIDTELAENNLTDTTTNWVPVSPADTRLFGIENPPYSRIGQIGFTDNKDIIRLALRRGMVFLGYTNTYLSDDEIETMAELEANAIINDIVDDKIKQSFSSVILSDFKNSQHSYKYWFGTENPEPWNVVFEENGFIFIGPDFIPLDKGFNGNDVSWDNNSDGDIQLSINESPTDSVFLPMNYEDLTTLPYGDALPYDGGYNIKIFDKNTFEVNKREVNLNGVTLDLKEKPFEYEKLKVKLDSFAKIKAAGFNVFNGTYGIQEFNSLNVKNINDQKELISMPLKNMFFVQQPSNDYSPGVAIKNPKATNYNTFETNDKTSYFRGAYYNPYKTSEHILVFDAKGKIIDDEYKYLRWGYNWDNLKDGLTNQLTYPCVELKYFDRVVNNSNENFSLFGSRWYYAQSESPFPMYAKALLFLSTIRWNGDVFESLEIQNLFKHRGGFIHVPRLWAAYIGGLIWRSGDRDSIMEGDIITDAASGPGNGVDPIIWEYNNEVLVPNDGNFVAPTKRQEINKYNYDSYHTIPDYIIKLPFDVRKEFKKVFFNFVHSNSVVDPDSFAPEQDDFTKIDDLSSLVSDGTIGSFDTALNNIYAAIQQRENQFTSNGATFETIPKSVIVTNLANTNNYEVIRPLHNVNYLPKQIALEYKGTYASSKIVTTLLNMIDDEVIIANNWPFLWDPHTNLTADTDGFYDSIEKYVQTYCSVEKFNTYFNKMVSILNKQTSELSDINLKKQREQEIFGTSDENIIKLELYKTCKNINDKWLAGETNIDNILFQCGQGHRNPLDYALAKKYRNGSDIPRLIDSFRFVTRSFKDIGDELYINPIPVGNYLIDNPNSSFYDCIGNLLGSNNFDFIALPNYINYNDEKELNSIFEPMQYYNKPVDDTKCGPSFVCVYVGNDSKHLDTDSNFPNDGFDARCDSNGNLIGIPNDFADSSNDYENDVAIFAVKFGQQNQNIFKDVTLDQSEFPETAETLQIVDSIAKKGSENNRTLAGQNIYNVYGFRSYKAEVEMMGNAMIQPMMHFQLDNIPMYHGVYLITHAKHNIKPNYMSTIFSGVRVRYAESKIISAYDMYMSLLDAMDLANTPSGNSNGTTIGNYPIRRTMDSNGFNPGVVINGDGITIKNITISKFDFSKTSLVKPSSLLEENETYFLAEGIPPLIEMLNDLTTYLKSNSFVTNANGGYIDITSMYRTEQGQDEARKNNGVNASAGISNHEYGLAIDFQYYKKNGDMIENYIKNTNSKKVKNLKEGWDYNINLALDWLVDHSHDYGFVIPLGVRNNNSKEEFWHFEYMGKAAKCLLAQSPKIKTKVVNTSTPYKASVTNPKEGDGTFKDYTKECQNYDFAVEDLEPVVLGSNADFWALAAICSLENGTSQGRVDVAQSILNRQIAPNTLYKGDTVKELIVSKNQYEPVGRAIGKFKAIQDKGTAIDAVYYSNLNTGNKLTREQASKFINDTVVALKDVNLQTKSASGVGNRTDFRSKSITIPTPNYNLFTRDNQVFGFMSPNAIDYGKKNPAVAGFPDFSKFS